MQATVRILSIDGGGIRGILPAVVLANLERRTGKPISQLFDLVAGTSTGGLLALGLTAPASTGRPMFRAADMVQIYESYGPRIFRRAGLGRLRPFGHLLTNRYGSRGIERCLQEIFGDLRLSQALRPVLLPSYEMERQVPFFFRSRMARLRPDHDFAMWEAARATSAAPTYFPPFRLPGDGEDYFALVDGGLFANNPALCALVEAQVMFPQAKEFLLVSLGTGEARQTVSVEDARHWGVAQWAKPIVGMALQSVSKTVDYQLEKLFGGPAGARRYYRLQTHLPEPLAELDRTSRRQLRELRLAGEAMVRAHEAVLDEVAARLPAGGAEPSIRR